MLVALLYKREVLVPVLANWYGVPESTIQRLFDALEADLFDSVDDRSSTRVR